MANLVILVTTALKDHQLNLAALLVTTALHLLKEFLVWSVTIALRGPRPEPIAPLLHTVLPLLRKRTVKKGMCVMRVKQL